MIIGYARVSTTDQKLDLQLNALRSAGCEKIYEDRGISGSTAIRPGLGAAIKALNAGDTLVVWSLDRLGRSIQNLIEMVNKLNVRKIQFLSLREAINTTSSGGRLFFHILAALAEFERNLISERTQAGLAAARARGQTLGRPAKLSQEEMVKLHSCIGTSLPPSEIARLFGISTSTVYRLRQMNIESIE